MLTAGKPLDRPFLRIATLAMIVQFATGTIQNLVAECSAVCESPIELAMCFALAIVAREGDRRTMILKLLAETVVSLVQRRICIRDERLKRST